MTPASPLSWRLLQRVIVPRGDGTAALAVTGDAAPADRAAFVLDAGATASFAAYLSALPLGYWRRHTDVRQLRLALTVDGVADIVVRASDAAGRPRTLARRDAATGEVVVDLDVSDAPDDGGWLWFDASSAAGATLRDAAWSAPAPATTATATICITTLNRRDDCLGVLSALADDPVALDRLDGVIVVDQGTQRLREADGFAGVAERLGARLRVIEQPNIGGSGGFSRGMLETAAAGTSTHALLLDDDVALEPDAVVRLLSFAEHATRPLVVGGQMLSLVDPTQLHSMGERIDPGPYWWVSVDPELYEIDLAGHPLAETPALHRRLDVEYNGWWMCLIPTDLVRRAGAALPLFIKWDDVEYSLRAAEHGVPTVTLPGAAIWHMPWTAKDDGLDWQAYYQLRNRLVSAILHSPLPVGGRILPATLAQEVNHLLCLQYGSVILRRLALRDVLAGPGHLAGTLLRRTADARRLLEDAGQVVVADTPHVTLPLDDAPRGPVAALARLARVVLHQLRPVDAAAPAARFSRTSGRWWQVGRLDAVALESATGAGFFALRRDRATALRALVLAVTLRVQLAVRWGSLRRAYRNAAPDLASAATWEPFFRGGAPNAGGTGI